MAIKPLSQAGQEITPLDRAGVEGQLRALAPAPYAPDRAAAAPAIERFLAREPKTDVLWIADGIELGGASALSARLASLSRSVEVVTDGSGALALAGADNEAGALTARLTRSDARAPGTGTARALDAQGREVGRAPFDFGAKSATEARFDLPVELRNEVTRVVVDGERSAGATWLIDERSRRRRVAIASGASADVAQPLLAPSYYLRRALQPFADISEWHDSSTDPIVSLLEQKPSVLVLADMSVAPGPELDAITQFLDNGGVLLRFAGTRLAAGDDTLDSDRLAPRRAPARRRVVLGEPEAHRPVRGGKPLLRPCRARRSDGDASGARRARDRTCRRRPGRVLLDGTPLVTAERRGKGLIVLFHVTADTTWSNLPLSGLFVDMLKRIVAEADAPGEGATKAKVGEHGVVRPPLRTLNGFGVLGPPPARAEPIGDDFSGAGDALHPPGFHGTPDSSAGRQRPGGWRDFCRAPIMGRLPCMRARWRSRRRSIFAGGFCRRLSSA